MTSDRKHPTAAFWITVALLALLVAYPLTFGPACWIASRLGLGNAHLANVYRPIIMAMATEDDGDGPYKIVGDNVYFRPQGVMNSYAQFGARERWTWSAVAEYRKEFEDVHEWHWEWCDGSKQ